MVDLLLQRGADTDHQEATQGWTALIWAATRATGRPFQSCSATPQPGICPTHQGAPPRTRRATSGLQTCWRSCTSPPPHPRPDPNLSAVGIDAGLATTLWARTAGTPPTIMQTLSGPRPGSMQRMRTLNVVGDRGRHMSAPANAFVGADCIMIGGQ